MIMTSVAAGKKKPRHEDGASLWGRFEEEIGIIADHPLTGANYHRRHATLGDV